MSFGTETYLDEKGVWANTNFYRLTHGGVYLLHK